MDKNDQDAKRWRYAVEKNCFPVISQDGETWVAWARDSNYKRRTFMGKSPEEAIDAAMRYAEGLK